MHIIANAVLKMEIQSFKVWFLWFSQWFFCWALSESTSSGCSSDLESSGIGINRWCELHLLAVNVITWLEKTEQILACIGDSSGIFFKTAYRKCQGQKVLVLCYFSAVANLMGPCWVMNDKITVDNKASDYSWASENKWKCNGFS